MLYSFLLFFSIIFLFFVGDFDLRTNLFFVCGFFVIFVYKKFSILQFLNRIKYFLLALFFIFALATPGKVLAYYSFISVTSEGILLGLNNVFRLMNTFLLIIILMNTIPKDFISLFIVLLCFHLNYIGVNSQRLAARIYLTLAYLESYRQFNINHKTFFSFIEIQLSNKSNNLRVKIEKVNFTKADFAWFCGLISFIVSLNFFIK